MREQYRGLVEASVDHVASLARQDRETGGVRGDLPPTELAQVLLATIIGAQTMAELGVAIDASALATTVLTAIAPKPRERG